ncbi:phosphonate C-P lyase system protein PhnH [Pseudogemmobacter sp. W21_MBD1_M6]|uniref:phosphonate C-P lyase system protein PhnH n=1 Tax=Pseudogemmobacter sp. W21_MBD1_M6 TaxID=3240271 RepID=UPI003F98A4DC
MQAFAVQGGFGDTSVEASHAFRAAMNAMARPGRVYAIGGARPPVPMSVAAGTLCLTLFDPETPVHLAGGHDTADIRDWITFHTGAPLVGAARCAFALGTWDALGDPGAYSIGQADYPDRSATLIVELPAFTDGGATLRGPGIKDSACFGLPDLAAFQDNARLFPLGLDFFFTTGDRVAGLPRTTRVG